MVITKIGDDADAAMDPSPVDRWIGQLGVANRSCLLAANGTECS